MAPAANLDGDGSRFRTKHALGDRLLILFLARRQEYKGYHALRQAMNKLLIQFPSACLVVAGEDSEPPYPALTNENVLDLGSLRSLPAEVQEKSDALAACDIFCMPSTAEAFGLVYAEAWSYGKPVVGGMAPALKELIEDGVNGFRVSQDPEAIAERLTLLCGDPQLRAKLGAAGQAKQQQFFTWPSVVSTHLRTWRNVRTDRTSSQTMGVN